MAATVQCFGCGTDVPAGSRFCGHCGRLITDPQTETLVDASANSVDLIDRLRRVLSGEFTVEKEVARGGMGVVFRAVEDTTGRLVALKVLSPELGLTVRAAERFKREGRLVAELEHPNIVPVYRVGQLGGVLFIAMRFIEGRSLDEIVAAQGALPIPAVMLVLRAAARALTYAHGRDIVHRDVKAGNILLDRAGRVMVSDFGVALRASDVTLTADGTVIGTPAYMSPEQCAGKRATPQGDQYSLGIVAFQMLTGALPFAADSLPGIMHHHFFTPLPDLRLARDDVPAELLPLIERMVAKAPADRFAATRDLLDALEALPLNEVQRRGGEELLQRLSSGDAVASVATRSLPALPDAPTVPFGKGVAPRLRRWRWKWAAAASLAVVAGVAGWLALKPVFGSAADSAGDSAAAAVPPPAAPAPAPAAGDSAPSAPQAPRVAPGRLRLLTAPGDAEIVIDGRRRGVGGVLDLPLDAGSRRLQIRAPGYVTFDTTLSVGPDQTVSLGRITLRPSDAGTP